MALVLMRIHYVRLRLRPERRLLPVIWRPSHIISCDEDEVKENKIKDMHVNAGTANM